jgi:hypothetical protein
MLTKRSEKYSPWVARLSASGLPPLSTRSTSSTMARKEGRSVSSAVMARARSSGTPAFSRVDSSCVKEQNVAPAAAGEGGQLQLVRFLGRYADVDGGEPCLRNSRATNLSVSPARRPVRTLPSMATARKKKVVITSSLPVQPELEGGQYCPQPAFSRLDAVRVSLSPTHHVGVCGIMNGGCPIGTWSSSGCLSHSDCTAVFRATGYFHRPD